MHELVPLPPPGPRGPLMGEVWSGLRASLVSAILLSFGICPTCVIMPVLSWMLMLMLLLFVAGTYTKVAPQDADSFCLNLPSRPETNPRQVILLDTANYRGQDLVTIVGHSRMWISLKLLPGPSNQKVRLALRMHAVLTLLLLPLFIEYLWVVLS